MKLIRFGQAGQEKPGVVFAHGGSDERRIDVSGFGEDFDEKFFATDGIVRLGAWIDRNGNTAPVVAQSERLGPPICRPSKIICIGLNYGDHARETKAEPPKEPVLFMKATSALCGPNDRLVLPRGSEQTDWEVELAIVIGKRASYVSEAEAMSHIAGYALMNDYSERHFQKNRGGQWVKGKSADTFAPLGPFVATKDEIPKPNDLKMWLRVNGELRQNSSTAEMIFKVPFLVSYISQFMSLLPGDVISTGTPAGVGLGMNPPQFLKAGDVIELGVEGLGESRQEAVAYD